MRLVYRSRGHRQWAVSESPTGYYGCWRLMAHASNRTAGEIYWCVLLGHRQGGTLIEISRNKVRQLLCEGVVNERT